MPINENCPYAQVYTHDEPMVFSIDSAGSIPAPDIHAGVAQTAEADARQPTSSRCRADIESHEADSRWTKWCQIT
jgi:hypothetical protein